MAEQELNRPQVGARFEKMRRVRVPYRRRLDDRGQNENGDRVTRGKWAPGACDVARRHGRRITSRYQTRFPDDRGRGEFGLAEWPCHARREELHQDRSGLDTEGSGSCRMAP